jgi:competence protein ComEC
MFFFLGMILVWNVEIKNHDYWLGNHLNYGETFIIKIEEPLTEKEKSFSTIGSIISIVDHDSIYAVSGKIILQFKKTAALDKLYYGDKIAVKKIPNYIFNNSNPGGFNYVKYMSALQIYHQLYLSENDFIKINKTPQKDLYYYVYKLRDQTISKLHFYFNSNQKVLGIAEALMIGYKNNLDKEVVSAYSKTGVVHIIAISGLHLGLIYMLLIWIFKRIPLVKRIALVQSIAIICCLWIFSLITGASASVLRSAVMFTCIIFGKTINRKSSIYNSIAGSAFLLLCYNPLYFWDVGFELSYLAIIGIVWLQKPIQSFVSPKFIVFKKIWEMSSVTLAAQIMSFPICIYYFHQFPNYFLISNLIAIPLSTLILFAEIVLICFSWVPFINVYVAQFIYWNITLMNNCIEQINNFPFSVFDNINTTISSTIFIYGIIFSIILFWVNKKRIYISLFFLFISSINFSNAIASIKTSYQRKIIIYNINNHTAVDLVEKQDCYFIGDSIFNQSSTSLKKNIYTLPDYFIDVIFPKKICQLKMTMKNVLNSIIKNC